MTHLSALRRSGGGSFWGSRVLACLAAVFLAAAPAFAAESPTAPVPPDSVLLAPSGAVLHVAHTAPVRTEAGRSVVEFVLPGGAQNLEVRVPGHALSGWSASPLPLEASGGLARQRAELEHAVRALAGKLEAVKARLALWQGDARGLSLQELAERDKRLTDMLPNLSYERADLEHRLALAQEALKQLPQAPELGELVSVVLQKPVSAVGLPVRYSYSLVNCGWRPVYTFEAVPDAAKGDTTRVRLLAEAWQHSGMDWDTARLTLANGAAGPREPAPLPRWVVEARPQPVARMAAPQALMMAVGAKADAASVEHDASGVYATWTPQTPGLAQGKTRLLLAEDVWKTPLQWLARPVGGQGTVWLRAQATPSAGTAWPDGAAEFFMDGQRVGAGFFRPRGAATELFFGPDPRVSLRVTADSRGRGESGLVGKTRTWTWAWTYTVANARQTPIPLRLERPLPEVVDQDVRVSFKNSPAAKEESAEHRLVWELAVPAGGSATVRHELRLSAPADLPLTPTAP
ncbi:DUF4139 domain-containing protein [Desulfovibrio legallii]|uniref:DUF4139 domain-containing protein n=1 Tax=Desulfovibrio legallii TaxID=571438 RepID=A0A1G7HZY0_9BACT|nr:DUF4139 domain-containing protein [Desulfovibrio legallii]SDF06040.1 protein of unknown function [Desulfovibrio legallii]